MSSDEIILQSFETALSEAAAGLDVAYMNVRLNQDPDAIYLEAHNLPAGANGVTLGDGHVRKVGIYQVTVVGLAGVGMAGINAVAARIESAFPRGMAVYSDETTRVLITEPMSTGPLIPDGPRVRLPLSIEYQADIYNNNQ